MDLEKFIREKLTSQDIAIYIDKLAPEATVDEAFFPAKKQVSLKIQEADRAETRVRVLRPSAFDVAAKVRALSASVNVKEHNMPFFKESILLAEKDRRTLIEAAQSNNEMIVDTLLEQVYENYAELVEGGLVQMKRMRIQLIQHGSIYIAATDTGNIEMNYDIPENHKFNYHNDTTKKWTNPDADIIGDILKIQQTFTDAGKEAPKRVICTEKTFQNTIMVNNAIREDLSNRALSANIGATGLIITQTEFETYMKTRFGITFAYGNGAFLNENGEEIPYYEDGIMSFLPNGPIGNSIYSYTPEEFDKSYGSKKLDTSIVRNYISITNTVKDDPVTVETKVSMVGMPSLTRGKSIFLATVY